MIKSITREEVVSLIEKLESNKMSLQTRIANIDDEISRCQIHIMDIDNGISGG